jgi:hypothetical protein
MLQVTTIDQETLTEGLEPLGGVLRELRSAQKLGWDGMPKAAVFFATNLLVLKPGVIARGDAVEVASKHEGTPKQQYA